MSEAEKIQLVLWVFGQKYVFKSKLIEIFKYYGMDADPPLTNPENFHAPYSRIIIDLKLNIWYN